MAVGAGRKKQNREEQQFQIALVEGLRIALLPGTMVFHVPNGGKRNKVEAAILKAMGVRKGFPDLGLIRAGHLFCMELKRLKGGRLSKDQMECRDELLAAGVPVVEVRTVDEALAALRTWNIPTRIKGATV